MSAPSGYTALDFVGFTDKGTYSPSATYMRNDLVHYGGNIMRCLIDNTTNVTPVVGANWELWVGASANLVERVIAPLENNPADVAYGVGRQIIYDDWLWEVIAPIAVGDALVDYAVDPTNANIKKSAPVETQLLAVKAEADATDNMIAPTEASASSSSAPYSVGDQLILNNILYDVIAAIQIGDVLTTGTGGNIAAADNLTDQLAAKANSSDLGTAAAKNSTNAVTSGSTALVESGAVYSEVDSVKQALTNKMCPTFLNVASMKTYDAEAGETLKTLSYYNIAEGGAATYSVGDSATYDNSYMSIPLDNGKYANLIIENYTIYLDAIGGSSDPNVDNGAIINLIVNNAAFYKYRLVLGNKKYYCTTTIQDTQSVDIIGCYVNTYNTDYNHNKSQLSFTAVSVNNTAIIFNNNGAIKGVVIRGNFVTCTENRELIGSTPGTPYHNWITFAETIANTIGIDCRNSLDNYTVTIEDCCIDGFTRGIYTSYWSKTVNCTFARISNQAIIMDNDSMVTNCRFVQCRVAIITANLSVISCIRGDSIKESMIKVLGTSNVISNIQGDYCGRNVVEMSGTANGTNLNNIAGRYGIDYVGIDMDNLSGDDLGYNALISGTNTKGAVLTGIDGRFRELDDHRPLTGVILSFVNVNRTAAIMSSNENNRLSGTELKKYVYNYNNCNYSVTIGKYNYIYSSSNVQTPTLEAVS